MNARAYLLTALLFTACYDDSNSEGSSGSGGTGTTSSTSGGSNSQTSGGAGGTGGATTGGVTTNSGTATGGSAGDGQAGAAGGGAAASAGGESGAGGEGGASSECVPALYALVRSTFGDFHCPDLETCFVEQCPDELALAVGEGWPSGDHAGGICAAYVDCVEACACESECSRECRDEHANGGACLDAIVEVSLCRNDACPAATDSCEP